MSAERNSEGSEFQNPLATRYAGKAIREIFSPRRRSLAWRDLWIALAEAQKELGLSISDEQIAELRAKREEIDFEAVARYEKDLRHDVMAHVHHYGDLASSARGILHLGATSCYVTDNGDLLIYREAMEEIERRLRTAIGFLAAQARAHRDEPCLAYTHFQPAQPTTLGKRICLWIQDFLGDLEELERLRKELPMRGAKGTTGTQASYLTLFDGDHEKVRELDRRVAEKLGFSKRIAVSGQTYSRKLDHRIHAVLAGIAMSAAKFGVDMRLLSHEGEVSEPFTDKQIGSSAMAYKRNPMRSERICSLARLVASLEVSSAWTSGTQWLERTLDDSAIRRISLPESFLAIDACLMLVANIAKDMRSYPKMMLRNLSDHLPFMATEEILMEGVRGGLDRQDLHEWVRVHAVDAGRRMKEEGIANPLLELLRGDTRFSFCHDKLESMLDPMRFVGRAREQVDEFLAEEVVPVIGDAAPEFDDEVRV